ncbi:hypothetical protein HRbin36_01562 [bacterium HR36]|nr:hypothetical protein HRbin36_01562 [bacterium HR36]
MLIALPEENVSVWLRKIFCGPGTLTLGRWLATCTVMGTLAVVDKAPPRPDCPKSLTVSVRVAVPAKPAGGMYTRPFNRASRLLTVPRIVNAEVLFPPAVNTNSDVSGRCKIP